MPVYEEKGKVNGQKRYFVRTYITTRSGINKQVTKHNKLWVGRDGYRLASKAETEIQEEYKSDYTNIKLSELYEYYINYCENIKKLKPSSVIKIKDNYRLYIEPFFQGKKEIRKIQNRDVLCWHDWLIKTKNLSNKFNRNIHITLVTMLNFGCKFYDLDKNVASICGNFEVPKGTKRKEINFLTQDEFNIFISNESNEIYKCFFTTLFYTGMRLGELWCLTWDDVNFDDKTLNINKAYNPKNGVEMAPKTNKSNRTIQISDIVINSLKTMEKYKSNKYIFGTEKITGTTLRRKCQKNYELVDDTKRIRIHDFRHSFASMCINKNVPISIISEYLGHENTSTTLDIYGHLYPNMQNLLIKAITNIA